MNWEAIGAIGEIIGAFAVVFSLASLATQIRSQNRESRIASIHEVVEAFRYSDEFRRFVDQLDTGEYKLK